MSGPKAFRVRVVSPAERLRRQLAAVEARCTVLLDRLAAAAGSVADKDSLLRVPEPGRRSLAELEAWEGQLEAAVKRADAVRRSEVRAIVRYIVHSRSVQGAFI
jgi:hypothetical protein